MARRMAQPTGPELGRAQERALELGSYWSLPLEELLRLLGATRTGLSSTQAAERLDQFGRNALREDRLSWLIVLAGQLKSPLVLLLVFAAVASALTGEWVDAVVVLVIVLASVALGFSREFAAQRAAAALKARVQTRVGVLRDGRTSDIPSRKSCRETWCNCLPAASYRQTVCCSRRRTFTSVRLRSPA